jgi:hypothetical protein
MSVRCAFVALLLCATPTSRAWAEAPAEPESEPEPRLVNASGLVPLRELNSRPYAGLWLYDFRFHEYELGLGATSLGVSGNIVVGQMTIPVSDSAALFLGPMGSYYLPLVGYSPSVSFGLVPELHLQLGGFAGGTTTNYTDELAQTKVGTALQIPLFAMLRVGKHASRYSDWEVSLGAGIGVSLLSFNTGQPVRDSGSYLAPALRAELGYGSFKLGFESALGSHDNFDANSTPVRLAYRAQTLTLTLIGGPDPED